MKKISQQAASLLLAALLQLGTPAAIGKPETKTAFNQTAFQTQARSLHALDGLRIFGESDKTFSAGSPGKNKLTFVYFGLPFSNPNCNKTYAELEILQKHMESQCPGFKNNIEIICVFPYSKSSTKPLNNLLEFDGRGFTLLYGPVDKVTAIAKNFGVEYQGSHDQYPQTHDKELAVFMGEEFKSGIDFASLAEGITHTYEVIEANNLKCPQ